MIVTLWHRWFDAREYRRALRVAERNYSRTLAKVAQLTTDNEKLRRDLARLAVAAEVGADSAVADRIEALEERAVNAERSVAEQKKRVRELERQLDEVAVANERAVKIVDQHAQVSKLPPALNRDRAALNRMAGDLADARAEVERLHNEVRDEREASALLRAAVEKCEKEHR